MAINLSFFILLLNAVTVAYSAFAPEHSTTLIIIVMISIIVTLLVGVVQKCLNPFIFLNAFLFCLSVLLWLTSPATMTLWEELEANNTKGFNEMSQEEKINHFRRELFDQRANSSEYVFVSKSAWSKLDPTNNTSLYEEMKRNHETYGFFVRNATITMLVNKATELYAKKSKNVYGSKYVIVMMGLSLLCFLLCLTVRLLGSISLAEALIKAEAYIANARSEIKNDSDNRDGAATSNQQSQSQISNNSMLSSIKRWIITSDLLAELVQLGIKTVVR